MSQSIYFRKDKSGRPIPQSDFKATRRPSSAHIRISNVFGGPMPDFHKKPFSGGNRYFIQYNEVTGDVIHASLIASPTVPSGFYLELFANNIVALPFGDTQEAGVLPDDYTQLIEDEIITDIPELLVSQNYIQNGYRR